jgi:3-deoxy-D-manno-octulosonate 8-phosphate phosphatase (KDO 8-P phosphatase)
MTERAKADLRTIEMLVLDVDGVLTDGRVITHSDGSESKCFHVLDGHGIRLWQRAGLQMAWLSGRVSTATMRRAEELQVQYVLQDCHVKLPALQQLLERLGMPAGKVAYVGDDLMDVPVLRYVGFAVAVADAVAEVRAHADYVTTRPGGRGAVREVIEYILKNSGRWDSLVARYLA